MPMTPVRAPILLWLGCLALLAPASAQAGEGANCTISATSLTFGSYLPTRHAPTDFNATINLDCTTFGTAPVPIHGTIAVLGSTVGSGRQLTDGPHRLRYELFLDPARTLPWGDGSGAGQVQTVSGVAGPNAPLRQTITVYGRILARQSDAPVGDYIGQIVVILRY